MNLTISEFFKPQLNWTIKKINWTINRFELNWNEVGRSEENKKIGYNEIDKLTEQAQVCRNSTSFSRCPSSVWRSGPPWGRRRIPSRSQPVLNSEDRQFEPPNTTIKSKRLYHRAFLHFTTTQSDCNKREMVIRWTRVRRTKAKT